MPHLCKNHRQQKPLCRRFKIPDKGRRLEHRLYRMARPAGIPVDSIEQKQAQVAAERQDKLALKLFPLEKQTKKVKLQD